MVHGGFLTFGFALAEPNLSVQLTDETVSGFALIWVVGFT